MNVNEDVWRAVLNREKEVEAEKELEELGMESDDETESESGEEEMESGEDEREFVSDFEEESDLEDLEEFGEEVSFVALLFLAAAKARKGRSRTELCVFSLLQFNSGDDDMSDEEDDSEDAGDEDSEEDDETPAQQGKRKAPPAPPTTKGKGKAPVQPKKPRRSTFFLPSSRSFVRLLTLFAEQRVLESKSSTNKRLNNLLLLKWMLGNCSWWSREEVYERYLFQRWVWCTNCSSLGFDLSLARCRGVWV